ncbi:DUF883 family protein [Oxalobacteraceae bacterium OM1]|nr:DUF883 family protein [Oxalobacteraceae bacterium OM1]
MENSGSNDIRDRLVEDLKLVIKDAEDLLRSSGQQASEGYAKARAKFESTLSTARSGLTDGQERLMGTTREAMETADEYVRANPWQAVGIGALAGLLVGVLVSRR